MTTTKQDGKELALDRPPQGYNNGTNDKLTLKALLAILAQSQVKSFTGLTSDAGLVTLEFSGVIVHRADRPAPPPSKEDEGPDLYNTETWKE